MKPPAKKKTKSKAPNPFGAENRARLIDNYFREQEISSIEPSLAWQHVYRLLLWVDQRTGLGHCYESDKCQPGRPWYARSLAFHDWVSSEPGHEPGALGGEIDWLFMKAAEDLATEVMRTTAALADKAAEQRAPYQGRQFPSPGEDPELVSIVREVLGEHICSEPSAQVWTTLVQRIRQYLALDNKRKNLVGEGFEDVIAAVIRRTCENPDVAVYVRAIVQSLPGFSRPPRSGEKPNKVDLAVIKPQMRSVVTAKWSVRADREKQFISDFSSYVEAESSNAPWSYVFVTNEFDPARLMRACEQLAGHSLLFSKVVHISTDALRATYSGSISRDDDESSIARVIRHIESGRLISLGGWLESLNKSS